MVFKKVENTDFADMARIDRLNRLAFPPGEYVDAGELVEKAGRGYFDFWALYVKSGVPEADEDVFARACDEMETAAGCGKGKGINSKEDSVFDSGFKGIGEPGFEAGKQGTGAAEGMEFIGFMVVVPFEDLAYLSFFAIEPAWRSRGYGSRALQALPEVYPGYRHLIDIEMLDENCPNNAQRIRRRAFYLRNGYRPTGQLLSYFGGDFEMLIKGGAFRLDDYKRLIASLDIPEFQPVYFTKDNRV